MKINNLVIKGFRSLYDVTWQPGDLNVIIGPNGSGKSNLLKALEMLVSAAQGRLGRQVLLEGGMGSLVWDGRASDVAFDLRLGPTLEIDRSWLGERIDYSLHLARAGASGSYHILQEALAYLPKPNAKQPSRLAKRSQNNAQVFVDGGWKDLQIDQFKDESLLSTFNSPLVQPDVIRICREQIASWQIYQEFSTQRDAPVRQSPVSHLETAISADGSNLVQVLHTLYTGNREFKVDLDLAMQAAFGLDFDEIIFPPAADQRIQLRVRWKSLKHEQSAADLSDGTLRYLYLIAILANPNPPALIAIDEPETGLHPSMLPIVAEYAEDAALRTQVILTTHSAELLDAFSDAPPTTTVARWEDGQTQLRVLADDALRYWLDEYTLGKMYRSGTLEAME
jgi:predicted ATPase